MTLQVGEIVDGKYAIVGLLGAGGMGTVYEAENVLIHRRVAIKVLSAEVAGEEQFARRFEREAQAAGRIGSDHIVEVLDLGTLPTGERFMVMEYLQGESLKDRMVRCGALPTDELVPIMLGLLTGLEDAHAAGIIHRDLKPDNIFLTSDREQADFVKIVDFGVSKFMHLGEDVTATGTALGTPRYMAPEQAKGEKDIDYRADIYSVGVILFRALAGRPPFLADTYNELMFKVVLEDPPKLTEVVEDADPVLSGIADRAMRRDRDARYANAREMADELRTWLIDHGHPVPVRAATRRQHLSTSGASGSHAAIAAAAVDAIPTTVSSSRAGELAEPSHTKHATAVSHVPTGGRRRVWPYLAVAAALTFVAVTAYRVGSDRGSETSPASPLTTADASGELVAEPTPSSEATATEVPSAEPSATASASTSAVPSASASATAAPSDTAPEPGPAATTPPIPTPVPPAPTGPKRTYRRTL